ncbi:MAG: dTMP kinase [Pirellulales bacterium]
MFFSFDGIDGSGKSTQMSRFVAWLEQQGHDVVVCRDPGSTPLGESLRELLLHRHELALSARAEMHVYMAARAQLVDEVIRPALEAGRTVVSDRYLLANVVYQGHAGGIEPAEVWRIGRFTVGGVLPDVNIVLDVPPETAAERLHRDETREPDRMERRGEEFRRQLRAGYLAEAAADPRHVVLVDATRGVEEIEADVRRVAQRVIDSAAEVRGT